MTGPGILFTHLGHPAHLSLRLSGKVIGGSPLIFLIQLKNCSHLLLVLIRPGYPNETARKQQQDGTSKAKRRKEPH